jgi:hypothetical protein
MTDYIWKVVEADLEVMLAEVGQLCEDSVRMGGLVWPWRKISYA